MVDVASLRALAERLDTHMGRQQVPVLLRDCRAASVGILALLDENERLRAALKTRNGELTDAQYMIHALVTFLGPNARKVWDRWQSSGVRRVHHDWGPDAEKMTGEERAALIFEVEDSLEEPDSPAHP